MTVIDAFQRDYDVVVAAECVASSDPEHHDVTLRYIDGHIARVLPTSDLLAVIDAGAR
jgi:isochorismate hydrolase